MNIEKIKEQVKDMLSSVNQLYTDNGVDANIAAWQTNKGYLIKLLSKHPNWDEDELAIVYTVKQLRKVERGNIDAKQQEFYNWMAGLVEKKLLSQDDFTRAKYAINNVSRRAKQEFTGEEHEVKQYVDVPAPKGKHCSKIIRAICVKLGLDTIVPVYEKIVGVTDEGREIIRKINEFEKIFAPFSDAFNPLVIENTAVLSIHPCDFLSQSNGNSWRSCHDIGFEYRGEYQSGVMSYMNDVSSMVFYTTDGKTTQDYRLGKKLMRQMFHYNKGTLVQTRLYPNGDPDARTLYRHIVQSALAECENKPNAWSLKRDYRTVKSSITTSRGSTHFRDYDSGGHNITASLLKNSTHPRLRVGTIPLCWKCGQGHYYKGSLSHRDCPSPCVKCGRTLNGGYHVVDGKRYCTQCSFHCNSCSTPKLGLRYQARSANQYNLITICGDCFEVFEYTNCQDCGYLVRKSGLTETEHGTICRRCQVNREYR